MVFSLHDEPIPGIDALLLLLNNTSRLGRLIALNPIAHADANKQKRETSNLEELSNNTILLVDSFWNSTALLA